MRADRERELIERAQREYEQERPPECRFCGEMFKSGRALGGHIVFCPDNPNRAETLSEKLKRNAF